MSAIIRVLYLLHHDPPPMVQLMPRDRDTEHQPLAGTERVGFIAIGVIALCSFITAFGLLSFLTYRFIFWQHYYKRPLSRNQYVLLIYNLLLADIQQATAFLLCLYWVGKGSVYHPSAACVLQGWWIQTADPGSGLFVIAIAMHTGAVVLRGPCIVGLWIFIILLGVIPVALYGHEAFVISEAGWCWLAREHKSERLWGHYFWIFLAEFGAVILYGIMFIYLRRRTSESAKLRQHHQDQLKRLNRVVIYMVIYPFMYLMLSLPLAAGRMSSSRHVVPSKIYFAVAGSLMALSGLGDTIVYTLTRRQLLLDTEISSSDKVYGAYSGSHFHQTHISTVRRDSTRIRMGSRIRRGLQSVNATFNDDRDGSTEDIVRKGDMELGDIGHGVYQETTIEITHELADSGEMHGHSNRAT
ncbi:hypothetical protein P175DRAFT_0496112 [Aspergillus ochraceoroseus IBT 24754]|uniref:G protein-coupled receptor GPR1/2/3 C-terminal domain-containing protein n=1 Tax=Aspergillus ochraceoroseus IBT 24754 TaxID=1392256 RepID=A0A2T5LNV0_9EURO|nr:uncharacterized protein P175DRAFT_0496112 [Aspergillus ochraceoroseus IBT 24754]PTU17956.1 hypothetical protein P175DRAFT_0496112 [Aspergillus ochraceoroseus IBT 24754]